MKLELIAATTFGLEAPVKREIENLGYKILKSEDGKITFMGDERAIVHTNLWLRSAERIQVKMAEFMAYEFEDLFQQVKAIPWEEWIPIDGRFIVNGSSVKSKLSSVPACQSVAEKAVIEKLKETYPVDVFEKTGADFVIKITILKDRVTVTLDTTGESLHKRGYRKKSVAAPIKETMAAAMINLTFWHHDRVLLDPCCGSGTIPIEAAMIERNIAPGLGRTFASEAWDRIPKEIWADERKKAREQIDYSKELKIYGIDIDKKAIEAAKENALEAGVLDDIKFKVGDGSKVAAGNKEGGIVISNPPYGERIGDKESIEQLYKGFSKFLKDNPTWSMFLITPDKTIESKVFGRPSDRRRKLYNGNIEVCYYQYHGVKPKKKTDEE